MAPARDSCAGATLVQWLAPPGCDLRRRDDLALAGSPDDHDDAGERCSECSRQPRQDRHQVLTGVREPAGGRRDAVGVDDELGQFLTEHAVLDGHVGVLREVHGDHLVGVTRVHLDLDEVPVLVRVDEGLRVDELVLAQLHFREAERVGDIGTRSDADVGGGNDRVTEHLSLLLLAVAQEDGLVDRLLVEHDLDGNRLILVQGERDGDRVVGRDDDVLRHTVDRDRHRDGGVVRVRERDEGVIALGVLTVGVGGHFGLLHRLRHVDADDPVGDLGVRLATGVRQRQVLRAGNRVLDQVVARPVAVVDVARLDDERRQVVVREQDDAVASFVQLPERVLGVRRVDLGALAVPLLPVLLGVGLVLDLLGRDLVGGGRGRRHLLGLVRLGGRDDLVDLVRFSGRNDLVGHGDLGGQLLLGRRSLGHGRLGRGFRVRDDQIGRDGVVEGQGIRSPNPHGREHHCRDQTNRYRSGLETRSPHGTPPICVLCKTRLWECV
jgi:hypothetical protein